MVNIEWLGHASFRITGAGKTIYIDPWKLKADKPKADLILISHSHYDHLSPDDAARISTARTQVICTPDCAAALKGMNILNVRTAGPEESLEAAGIAIRTTRAYNPKKQFHPKSNNWMGFLITLEGEVVYYSGDTDVIPEMGALGKVDVALLPVGGTYTMTAAEAAEAVKKIKPARAIPYHWGDIVGTAGDAQKFKEICNVPVEIQGMGQEKKRKAA